MDLSKFLRDVPDFPKPGIVFKDISPLLADPRALRASIEGLAELMSKARVERVIGIESRGFIFGVPVALELGVGFTPVRKPKKLPWKTRSVEYDLEYGKDRLEIHEDGVEPGQRVAIVDDLLATGGTAKAATVLTQGLGAVVAGCFFVVELGFLGGRKKLGGHVVESLVRFD
ncbi:MAG: adenine phosphoribosyltransferase [Planctomycetes bacterium]|nr:adenine phosphoribosyltransferase [Planctomycetota bacterium]